MDNIFEEKGYKLIELNLGYDDGITKDFYRNDNTGKVKIL